MRFNELMVVKGEIQRAGSKTGSDWDLGDLHWSNIPGTVELKREECIMVKIKILIFASLTWGGNEKAGSYFCETVRKHD